MDFYKVPIGFGLALSMNAPAMEDEQKQFIGDKSHNPRSKMNMYALITNSANSAMK